MGMPRTREQLERAAAEAEAWLDNLDPDDPSVTVDDTSDLRAIGDALGRVAAAERELEQAVRAARTNGRSWGRIGMVLGVSKQAALRRFGGVEVPEQTARSEPTEQRAAP
jgi:hypothetical protein